MDSERWEKLCAVFDAVRGMRGDALRRELDRRCGGDAALRREILELLSSSGDSEFYLARLAAQAGLAPPEAEEVLHAPGRRLGSYRLLKRLGRGGMGVVYLAERADELYEKRVAVKLLPVGLETPEAHERFARERAILAQLEHPNIARLLDGGVTEESTPFYVMEYVRGERLDRYCDRNDLDVDARLQLFIQVCKAVAYAHRHLVIHRDIKPANILVTPNGVAKLLDFGVAKLLDPDRIDEVTATRADRRLVSPAYAAPELLTGGRATTACDVYSLGMVLYTLLAGTTPFGADERTPADWAAAVRDRRIDPPSEVSARGRNRLRGDLDTIVLKALSAEPERRYASVGDLLEDINRYRAGHPVAARPDSVGYRLGKFWGRHRPAVVLVAMLAISIVGGFGVSLWQAREAALARDRAELEARRAQAEADTARRVAEFLGELFLAANPERTQGASLSAIELLGRGVDMIGKKFPHDPRIRAELEHRIGSIYVDYRMPERARPLLRRALETRRAELGPDHPDTAEVRLTLGLLAYREGDYEDSGRYLETARRAFEVAGNRPGGLANALNVLGLLHKRLGDYERAIADFERAIGVFESEGGEQDPDLARALNNLGTVFHDTARWEDAIPYFERALAIHEATAGPGHPMTAGTLGNLAIAHRMTGDLEAAEKQLRRAVSIMESNWGHDHPSVATNQSALARALTDLGELDEAEALLKDSLDILRRNWSPDHPYTAYDLNSLGYVYLEREDPAGAIPYFEEALAVREKAFGPEHPDVAGSLDSLAQALEGAERLDAALATRQRALDIWRESVAEDSPELLHSARAVAELQAATGKCNTARSLLNELPDEALSNEDGGETLAVLERHCE